MTVPTLQFDPNNAYPQATTADIVTSLGFLPQWMLDYVNHENSIALALEKNYAFFDQWRELHPESQITPKLTWLYPGDPPQEPLLVTRNPDEDEMIIFYPHAIVVKCTMDLNNIQYTRMD